MVFKHCRPRRRPCRAVPAHCRTTLCNTDALSHGVRHSFTRTQPPVWIYGSIVLWPCDVPSDRDLYCSLHELHARTEFRDHFALGCYDWSSCCRAYWIALHTVRKDLLQHADLSFQYAVVFVSV